ncbi:MAG: PIN domain-containing protein [Candidatus Viridilinea halotolerans]|uniref:PIN domain-containing protein n=1 Tax=Candidatus Viridilinea halotolerans TaxID=2491704 RepID=A0A426U9L3_9CHLR|nr:MAG: PIN domain-containing protein [Candidatus Viridilinea halotolerans]
MSAFYFDTSALAKRYLTEPGSAWVTDITNPDNGHAITVALLTRVEAAAAIAARQRAGTITLVERDAIIALLLHHFATEYLVISLSDAIVERAVQLTQQHRLRGYDAVQLAVALDANTTAVAIDLSPLTFVAADEVLLVAAHKEGLNTTNPNLYP